MAVSVFAASYGANKISAASEDETRLSINSDSVYRSDAQLLALPEIEVQSETEYEPANLAPMERYADIVVSVDGNRYAFISFEETVAAAIEKQGIVVNPEDIVSGASLSERPVSGMFIDIIRVNQEKVTEVEVIKYQTRYVLDKNLMDGEYNTITKGRDGSVTRTYIVEYQDGKFVSKDLVNVENVDVIDELIAYGAKSSFTNSRGQRITYTNKVQVKATAYIPDEKWGYQTECGHRARPGVIAVDPKVIPLNTKVYVQNNDPNWTRGDYGFAIAWDTGGLIKNNIIDLFMESLDLACEWGRRDCTVYILEDQTIDIFSLRYGDEVFMPK